MKPAPGRFLGVGWNGVFEITEHDVYLADQLRHPGAQLLEVRRHEMDHALELDRQFAQRGRRADRERLEEVARQLHATTIMRTSSANFWTGEQPGLSAIRR